MRTGRPEKQVRITGVGQSKVGPSLVQQRSRPDPRRLRAGGRRCGPRVADIDGLTTYPARPRGRRLLAGRPPRPCGAGPAADLVGASTEGPPTWARSSGDPAVASGLCRHVLVFRTVARPPRGPGACGTALSWAAAGAAHCARRPSWNVPFNAIRRPTSGRSTPRPISTSTALRPNSSGYRGQRPQRWRRTTPTPSTASRSPSKTTWPRG